MNILIKIGPSKVLIEKPKLLELYYSNAVFHQIIDTLHYSGDDENYLIDIISEMCKSNQRLLNQVMHYRQIHG